jgi:hypothetical protein
MSGGGIAVSGIAHFKRAGWELRRCVQLGCSLQSGGAKGAVARTSPLQSPCVTPRSLISNGAGGELQ